MGDTLPARGGGMPWKECHVMDERLRFVARRSRATRWRHSAPSSGSRARRATRSSTAIRIAACGVHRSEPTARPYRQANRLPPQLEAVIVRLKREFPGWGAPKTPREAAAAVDRAAPAGHQHGARRTGPPRPGPPAAATARRQSDGHRAVAAQCAERAVVCRLQG